MIELGPHAAFIVWSYLGVGIAIAVLVGALVVDARRINRRLAALEAQGVRRRSAESPS